MARLYSLVIDAGDGPAIPEIPPGAASQVVTCADPYPLLERIALECSAADLHHFKMNALSRIQREVAGVAPPPVPMSAVGKAVAT